MLKNVIDADGISVILYSNAAQSSVVMTVRVNLKCGARVRDSLGLRNEIKFEVYRSRRWRSISGGIIDSVVVVEVPRYVPKRISSLVEFWAAVFHPIRILISQ